MNRVGLRNRRSRLLAPIIGALLLLAGGASAAGLTASANAYTHLWPCEGYGDDQKCYDNSGQIYNHWHYVAVGGEKMGGYCAKGESESGGVIQFSCTSGGYFAGDTVCTNTETHAYVYSSVAGQFMEGEANTDGGC